MPSKRAKRLPLTALRTFESAARLESFKDAAEELGVSATTVSNQIRALERQWGSALFVRSRRPPDLAGRWELPNGSFWTVVQDGRKLVIEETHYLSREVWKRGSGVVEDDAIRVSLDWVFERMPPETGTLRLSSDGRTLTGELRVPDRDPAQSRQAPAALVKRQP